MKTIKVYPANKSHFVRLLAFSKKIVAICKELGITPVVWGGLAYFAYTKDKSWNAHDIDFLIPGKDIQKVIKILKNRKIDYEYVPEPWNSLIIKDRELIVELDPIEHYHNKGCEFKDFKFEKIPFKAVSLEALKKMYKHASEVSKDKPEQHLKRLNALKGLRVEK